MKSANSSPAPGDKFLELDQEQKFFLLHGLLSSFVSVRVEGLNNMPLDGGAILVCNHTDILDAVIQGLYSGRRLTFLAKTEIFSEDWSEKLTAMRATLREQGMEDEWLEMLDELLEILSQTLLEETALPIIRNYRTGSANGTHAYYEELQERVIHKVQQGNVVVIYPEGTRSDTGELTRFRGFAARIALRARVPIVPAGLMGVHGLSDLAAWARGKNRHRSVIYRIGRPIQPSEFPGDPDAPTKVDIKTLTRDMRERVRELLIRKSGRAARAGQTKAAR